MIKEKYTRFIKRLISSCLSLILILVIGTIFIDAGQDMDKAPQEQPITASGSEEVIDKIHYLDYSQEYILPLTPYAVDRTESYRLIVKNSDGVVRGVNVDADTWNNHTVGDHNFNSTN